MVKPTRVDPTWLPTNLGRYLTWVGTEILTNDNSTITNHLNKEASTKRHEKFIRHNIKRPNPVINPYPERVTSFSGKNVESFTPYKQDESKMKKVRILCDSIPKGIRTREFNYYLKNGDARIKSFPGSNANNMGHYAIPTLLDESPEIVVLHVGINDLLNFQENRLTEKEIAERIMFVAQKCKEYGVEQIFVSSLLVCKRIDQRKIDLLNSILKQNAELKSYVFIDNGSIKEQHLWNDGIHLNNQGKIILANNFLYYLNNFLAKTSPPWNNR